MLFSLLEMFIFGFSRNFSGLVYSLVFLCIGSFALLQKDHETRAGRTGSSS